jgi:hypothetical protein
MQKLLLQAQMLLTVLTAALPLAPAARRSALADVLETIGAALRFADLTADAAHDLADKIGALRAEVEAMAMAGDAIGADDLEAAFVRVAEASAAFRAALIESATA